MLPGATVVRPMHVGRQREDVALTSAFRKLLRVEAVPDHPRVDETPFAERFVRIADHACACQRERLHEFLALGVVQSEGMLALRIKAILTLERRRAVADRCLWQIGEVFQKVAEGQAPL